MYERLRYEKTYLSQVIARLDFVSPILAFDKGIPAQLGKSLSAQFPIVEPPQDAIAVELHIGPAGPSQQRQTAFKQWNFFGKEREKQLTVAPPFVFVTYTAYESYEGLRADVSAVLEALAKAYPDTSVGRFGLRYINNIEVEGLAPVSSWDQYISPVLLGPVTFFQPENLTRLVHIAETKCGELNLRFQFGMPNPDYPAPMKRPSFILDFDCYIQSAHDLPQSLQHMEKAHECIQELFEKSITDRLRERMNVRRAPAAIQK